MQIGFFPRWDNSTPGELMTWVGYLAFVLPAGCLLGYGVSEWFSRASAAALKAIRDLSARERLVALSCLTIVLICIFRVMRAFVLLDLPVTDDENAARFAGQIISGGQLMIEKPGWWDAAPQLFLYERDGMITSFDWPGAILVWAFSEVTQTGPWAFAILAGLPAAATFELLNDRHDLRWASLGTLVLVASPMFLMLSMTTHAHLGSRAFIAVALALAWFSRRGHTATIICFGASTAVAFMFRPVETSAVMAPVILWIVACAPTRRGIIKRVSLVSLGALGPILVFALYNIAITGELTPPRFADNEILRASEPHSESPFAFIHDPTILWRRFGANLSYNLLMLTIFIGGPLLMLAAFISNRRDGFARALTASVLGALGVALLHDDHGIHAVGPIHYSELAIPVVLLAIDGLVKLTQSVEEGRYKIREYTTSIVLGCLIVSSAFSVWHSIALRQQAEAQEWAYTTFEELPADSIVLVPRFSRYRAANPKYRPIGGWVFNWRIPHPYDDYRIKILHNIQDIERIEHFGDRPVFVAKPRDKAPWIEFDQLQ